ncbi:MAG: CNNM domain-containing protein, partial [bacterium]|nr:CNNM domain-containing protein [bacterium]
MNSIWAYLPGVLALLLLSGFFSGSEAAFFSLTPAQRRRLAKGKRTERIAATLLARSERLLMGVLFWNLAINIAYFSLASQASLKAGESSAALLSLVALIVIILFGEFIPKSIAVTYPLFVVRLVVLPLAFSIRLVDIFLPTVRVINEASRRLIWPGFKAEPY